MLALNPAARGALAGDRPRLGYFFRVATENPIWFWTGFGMMPTPPDAYDPEGAVYSGLGQIQDFPGVQQLVNGTADRATFTLSGITPEIMVMAGSRSAAVRGREVALGIAVLEGAWQILQGVIWLWLGTADYMSVTQDESADGVTRTLQLSVGSLFTGRRRPGLAYFTDPDQQARSPGDRFCERVIGMSQVSEKTWPRF